MKYILYVLLGMFLWIGCNDTETITPTLESEPGYYLPQGNHDFDEKIVDWNKRTGIYILYKYEPQDLFFNLGSSWLELTVDTLDRTIKYLIDGKNVQDFGSGAQIVTSAGTTFYSYNGGINNYGFPYTASTDGEFVTVSETYVETGTAKSGSFKLELPDEDYVGKQVELVEKVFLNFYSDDFLKKNAPFKIMLGRNLLYFSGSRLDATKNVVLASNMMVVNCGDETIDKLTAAQKLSIKKELNRNMILKLYDKLYEAAETAGFFKKSDYEKIKKTCDDTYKEQFSLYSLRTEWYKWGIINWSSTADNLYYSYYADRTSYSTIEKMKTTDFRSYLYAIMETSKGVMDSTPANGNWAANTAATGMLHEVKDVNHLIRDKYDILIQVVNKLGIDLQEMGNYK